MLPKNIKKFIEVFSKLPAIGPRMAHRLAFHLLNLSKQNFKNVKSSLLGLEKINRCPRCFFVKNTENELCEICSDSERNKAQIAIVEKEIDLTSIEKSGVFNGLYLVLGESDGKNKLNTAQKLRLKHLKKLAQETPKGIFEEIIIAVNLTTEGDYLNQEISRELKSVTKKITRLARGIPTGGEIEFADEETLSNAFKGRTT